MKELHGHAFPPELLRKDHAHDVAGCSGHVMAIVAPLILVLSFAPLAGARLAGDDDHLAWAAFTDEQPCLVEGAPDPTKRT